MAHGQDQRDLLHHKYSDFELFKRLIRYTLPHRKIFSVALVGMLLATFLTIIQPLLLKSVIDDYILKKDLNGLGFIAIIYFSVTVFSFLLNVITSYVTTITGLRIITKIREEAFYQLQELSMDYYDKEATGRIVSRITNDVERLLNLLSTGIIDAVVNVMFLGLLFLVLFSLDVTLSLTIIVFFPFLAVFIVYFRIKTRSAWQRTRRTLAKVTGYYQEAISGITVTKALSAEEFVTDEFNLLNLDNYQARIRALMLFAIMFPLMDLLLTLGTALVLSVGGYSVGQELISPGTLVAFLSYVTRLSLPIMVLSNFYNSLLSSMAAIERIFDILDSKPQVVSRDDKYLTDVAGKLVFNKVTFRYTPDTEPVLTDFSLVIPPQQTYALVGHTGAGKTTLASLLLRFYDFEDGNIMLDDVDIRDCNLENYRENIAIIPQDSFLFSDSIRNNLLYGNSNASDKEIERALLKVGAYDFTMSKGLDFQVGERGSRLSMGERQLICFARALLANPKILILDEATSSVDAHTELVIQQSMHNILSNRTTLVIAHRLSTIRFVDQIVVLDKGNIVEMGTFHELMNKGGIFTDLYEKQFAGQDI
ncbi:multidrug ABC transporter ATP-binding protein [Candidatus Heimdallarchaeota archaeon B3_Heim]|nr:MAG: multidrug ABC transporter ATP-binding protein [Candidatus Heimdallarchaeota archaeon B3_Heim]